MGTITRRRAVQGNRAERPTPARRPRYQFDIVRRLNPGQIVFAVSITEKWARADVEGDGQIDGFASAGFLGEHMIPINSFGILAPQTTAFAVRMAIITE
jgi:hypothetical protein